MYCPYCTAWNEDNAATCGNCGANLQAQPTQEGEPQQPQGQGPPPPPYSGGPPGQQPGGGPLPPPQQGGYPPPPPGQPPGGGYGGQIPPPPPQQYTGPYRSYSEPKTSVKAGWSLGLGIASILCCTIFTAIPGIILGIMALNDIKNEPQRFSGKGLAITGIVISCVAILIFLGQLLFMASDFQQLLTESSQIMQTAQQSAQTMSPANTSSEISLIVAAAIESYKVDNGEFPAWAVGNQGANSGVPTFDPAYQIPTFRIWSLPQEQGEFMTLTTPVAYMQSYPLDDYAGTVSYGVATYGYYTNGSGWIVYSAGPDAVYNINPIKDYTADQEQPSPALIQKRYDPTNGVDSEGDIFAVMEATGGL